MSIEEYDAIVLGAGPAGCGVGRLLATWGHRVLLVEKPAARNRALALSVPPSARNALAALGMLTAIDEAGFAPWRGNTVWWAGREPRIESFGEGAEGWQVLHRDLLRTLRPLATGAGAQLRIARVGEVCVPGLGDERAVTPAIVMRGGGADRRAAARFVLDCSGRAGVLARRGLRRVETSHHTVALGAAWRAHGAWPVPDDTHTLVASYRDGWAWSIPTAPGVRHVTVMVDPGRTDLLRGRAAMQVYRAELDKVRVFRAVLDAGMLFEGPWGHDASLYDASRYAGPGFLLVGDAGSFIDPLSSFGVKKALASAWVAAVATHTALVNPAMRDEALAFHDRRERAVYASCRRQAAAFAADLHEPFWLARARPADDGDEVAIDPSELGRDPRVLAAFEDLRRRSAIRLRRRAGIPTVRRPMIRDREIVMEEHFCLPACPDGIRRLSGTDLVALADLAPRHSDVGALYEAYARTIGPVALPDFLGALSSLIAFGVLEHDLG